MPKELTPERNRTSFDQRVEPTDCGLDPSLKRPAQSGGSGTGTGTGPDDRLELNEVRSHTARTQITSGGVGSSGSGSGSGGRGRGRGRAGRGRGGGDTPTLTLGGKTAADRSAPWRRNLDSEAVRYFTPPWLLEEVYGFFAPETGWVLGGGREGVDCDPCYDPESFVSARERHDIREGQDGLRLPWTGATFVNPPYDAPLPWLRKAAAVTSWTPTPINAGATNQVVMLVNAAPGTRAWRDYVFGCPHALVCFLAKRVMFFKRGVGYEGPNNRDSALIYYGPNRARFYERFLRWGAIVAPWRPDPDELKNQSGSAQVAGRGPYPYPASSSVRSQIPRLDSLLEAATVRHFSTVAPE